MCPDSTSKVPSDPKPTPCLQATLLFSVCPWAGFSLEPWKIHFRGQSLSKRTGNFWPTWPGGRLKRIRAVLFPFVTTNSLQLNGQCYGLLGRSVWLVSSNGPIQRLIARPWRPTNKQSSMDTTTMRCRHCALNECMWTRWNMFFFKNNCFPNLFAFCVWDLIKWRNKRNHDKADLSVRRKNTTLLWLVCAHVRIKAPGTKLLQSDPGSMAFYPFRCRKGKLQSVWDVLTFLSVFCVDQITRAPSRVLDHIKGMPLWSVFRKLVLVLQAGGRRTPPLCWRPFCNLVFCSLEQGARRKQSRLHTGQVQCTRASTLFVWTAEPVSQGRQK